MAGCSSSKLLTWGDVGGVQAMFVDWKGNESQGEIYCWRYRSLQVQHNGLRIARYSFPHKKLCRADIGGAVGQCHTQEVGTCRGSVPKPWNLSFRLLQPIMRMMIVELKSYQDVISVGEVSLFTWTGTIRPSFVTPLQIVCWYSNRAETPWRGRLCNESGGKGNASCTVLLQGCELG